MRLAPTESEGRRDHFFDASLTHARDQKRLRKCQRRSGFPIFAREPVRGSCRPSLPVLPPKSLEGLVRAGVGIRRGNEQISSCGLKLAAAASPRVTPSSAISLSVSPFLSLSISAVTNPVRKPGIQQADQQKSAALGLHLHSRELPPRRCLYTRRPPSLVERGKRRSLSRPLDVSHRERVYLLRVRPLGDSSYSSNRRNARQCDPPLLEFLSRILGISDRLLGSDKAKDIVRIYENSIAINAASYIDRLENYAESARSFRYSGKTSRRTADGRDNVQAVCCM